MQKLKNSKKIILTIVVLIAILLSGIAISNSKLFAEPTINELVELNDIGEFKPNGEYNNEDLTVVSWMNTTFLQFSLDAWTDTSGDGIIDVEDVYCQENFEQKMLMETIVLPIFQTTEESNYYIVSLEDFSRYGGAMIDLKISNNDDTACMKDKTTYWVDRNNKLLYISKDLIKEDIKNEFYNSIRMQIIMLQKNIDEATKQVDVATVFSSDIENLHRLDEVAINGDQKFNYKSWVANSLQFAIIPTDKLPYISKNNLEVFVNDISVDEWDYNETNGIITIYSYPIFTNTIVIKVNKLNEVTEEQLELQNIQSKNNEDIGQADLLEDYVSSNNPWIGTVKYDENMPEVGTMQELDYTAFVRTDSQIIKGTGAGKVPTGLWDIVNSGIDRNKKVGNRYASTTWCAINETPNARRTHGEVVYNMYLASKGDISKINAAVNITNSELFSKVTANQNRDTTYMIAKWEAFDGNQGFPKINSARYIVGMVGSTKSFLGGQLESGKNAIFDVDCARIDGPQNWINDMASSYGNTSGKSDYRTNATIIRVNKDSNGKDGNMYVCLWSQSLNNQNINIHTQRVLGFSKVKYSFNGVGTVQLSKINENGQAIAGAIYGVYKDNVEVATITSATIPVSLELTSGKYELKEITPPAGYLKDTESHPFTIVAGETVTQVVKDEYQMYDWNFTVYDATTKAVNNDRVEVPVEGIKFQLLDSEGRPAKMYNSRNELITNNDDAILCSDRNGKISGRVKAAGTYKLQQMGSVKNYYMTTDVQHEDCCTNIKICAPPTTSGKNEKVPHIKHYEHRQTIDIISQVQDVNLGAQTPKDLGGDSKSGAKVTVLGATYELYPKERDSVLLGYNKQGNAIYADPNIPLARKESTSGGKDNLYAYISATGDSDISFEYNEYGQKITSVFNIPNGEYVWKLVDVSSGYWNNNQKTNIDASWKAENERTQKITVEAPVQQTRQSVKLDLYVKSYVDESRGSLSDTTKNLSRLSVTFRNNEFTRIRDESEIPLNYNGPEWLKLVDPRLTKDITSNADISSVSTEVATAYNNNKEIITVKTTGTVKNAIYAIINIGTIVDINTGKEIPNGCLLGFYITDSSGKVTIKKLGTPKFINPNVNFNIDTMGKVSVLARDCTIVEGDLPNGSYALYYFAGPDDCEDEIGLRDDIVFKTAWKSSKQEIQTLELNSLTLLFKNTPQQDNIYSVLVAPDVPVDTTHVYKSSSNPEESKKIYKLDNWKNWIDNNAENFAYRILDSQNIIKNNNQVMYDVSDELPVTFGYYLNHDVKPDPSANYRYYTSYYYEITKAEYDAAPKSAKASGEYIYRNRELIYARRFVYSQNTNIPNAVRLNDVITLNSDTSKAPGFINYGEIHDKAPVWGAVYNSEWLNQKIRDSKSFPNGIFRILVRVDIEKTYVSKVGKITVVNNIPPVYGVLKIKNRELFELD